MSLSRARCTSIGVDNRGMSLLRATFIATRQNLTSKWCRIDSSGASSFSKWSDLFVIPSKSGRLWRSIDFFLPNFLISIEQKIASVRHAICSAISKVTNWFGICLSNSSEKKILRHMPIKQTVKYWKSQTFWPLVWKCSTTKLKVLDYLFDCQKKANYCKSEHERTPTL